MSEEVKIEEVAFQRGGPSENAGDYYPETAFRMESIPHQEASFATENLKKKKFVKRLGWSAFLGVNPTYYQYSNTSSRYFEDPESLGECEVNESRWRMRIDEGFNDLDVLGSFFESLFNDLGRFWDGTGSAGKYFI